jgi:hypothetical protein
MMRQAMLAGSLVDGAILARASTPVTAHADDAKRFAEQAAGYVLAVEIWQCPAASPPRKSTKMRWQGCAPERWNPAPGRRLASRCRKTVRCGRGAGGVCVRVLAFRPDGQTVARLERTLASGHAGVR